jgi:hypothetical protein
LLRQLLKAPIAHSFQALDIDYEKAIAALKKNGISVTDTQRSLEDISRQNRKDPEEVMELVWGARRTTTPTGKITAMRTGTQDLDASWPSLQGACAWPLY